MCPTENGNTYYFPKSLIVENRLLRRLLSPLTVRRVSGPERTW